MPWESCWFVARPGWFSVLKKTAKIHALWVEALEEGFVDEDDWRPFPELLPFARTESDLQLGEGAGLAAALRGVAEPTHEELETNVLRLLAPPKLTAAQRELLAELGYAWVLEWPADLREKLTSLDKESTAALAAAWKAAPGPMMLGSSADIGRAVDWASEVEKLSLLCDRADAEGESTVLWVGRNAS